MNISGAAIKRTVVINQKRFQHKNETNHYISKLVRELWLVNLAGRPFMNGPLKFKVFFFVSKLFSTYIANKSLKLSFILNGVLKRANDLKTISNWFVLFSTWFRNLKPFLMNGNHCRTLQTHSRDIINIFLTSSSRSAPEDTDPRFFPNDLWPARFALEP